MKSVHFIGIGGSGMSSLALYCLEAGYKVTGSDISHSTTVKSLVALGAEVVDNHSTSLLRDADAVVYSSAITIDNMELQFARDAQKKLFHRSEFLNELSKGFKCIAVAGSHGKTTTSAMITFVLNQLNLSPKAIIGGRMRFNNSGHLYGSGDLFVIEADESDGSFLNYEPFITVITNIGLDHLDHHESLDGLKQSFRDFMEKTDEKGGCVVGWDNSHCREIAENYQRRIVSYGTKLGCDTRLLKLESYHGRQKFDVMIERDRFQFELPLIGTHNALNAMAALSVFRILEINIADCIEALKGFPGVDRRLNTIFSNEELIVLDDYAHNPDKINACILAVKQNWPDYKLHVAFQPHRYSRLMTTWAETCSSFGSSDLVYLLPVYSAGESEPTDYNSEKLLSDIKSSSQKNTFIVDSFDNIVEMFDNNRSAKDIFLTIGAGDIFKAANIIGEHFGQKKEK